MSTALVPIVEAAAPVLPPTQADDDGQMVRLWLARSASPNTRRNYEREARRFLAHVGKPLGSVRIGDLQNYVASRPGSSATVALAASALKSLFTFAQEVGFLRFNIGAAVKVPPIKNTLAERIMSEADALLMIRQEPDMRNRVLLTVLYGGGLRISEVCGLRWRDLAVRDEAGQATIFGKGGKTRGVLLSAATWKVLAALQGDAGPDAPVFLSRKGGALDPSAVHRVVKAAVARSGLSAEISAHWLRHAHASHSLDRGAPIPPRSSDPRARLSGNDGALLARAAVRKLSPVLRGVGWRTPSRIMRGAGSCSACAHIKAAGKHLEHCR